jgi:hypothetical protein
LPSSPCSSKARQAWASPPSPSRSPTSSAPTARSGVSSTAASASWNPPDFLPCEKHPKHGILFLDELNSAAQGTAAAAYQLVLDRQLGDYRLPDGWHIVAAGNRMTDRALVNEMSTALKNRFTHVDVETNLDDWAAWAYRSGIHDSVIGFVKFSPNSLNEFEQRNNSAEEVKRIKSLKDSNAFATPRSWEFVSKLMLSGMPREVESDMIAGTIGDGQAAMFMGYLKYYRDMPNLDEILMNPTTAPVPKDNQPATRYAICVGLAARSTPDNFARVMTYVERAFAKHKEFQVLVVKDSIGKDREIATTKTFYKWAQDNTDIML